MVYAWTPEQDEILIEGFHAGETQPKIAARLGIPYSKIRHRISFLRRHKILPPPTTFIRQRLASIEEVQRLVCERFGVPRAALVGITRNPDAMKARQIGMALALKYCGRSVTIVGEKFRRNHTTVLHAADVAPTKYPEDFVRLEAVILEKKALAA